MYHKVFSIRKLLIKHLKDFFFCTIYFLLGCWNLQLISEKLIILHNLFWPGMMFYHKLNSPHYGFLYFGHGKKNMDIVFMV